MPFLISHETLLAYERPLCASKGFAHQALWKKQANGRVCSSPSEKWQTAF
jgi:hypothetical protein